MRDCIFGSYTRISNLAETDFTIESCPRGEWDDGDYVVCEVMCVRGRDRCVELATGRMTEVVRGDQIVGALGRRAASLELSGSWRAVGEEMHIDMLTAGGLFGRITSESTYHTSPAPVEYRGHVKIGGRKARMADYVGSVERRELRVPIVLVIGTSVSAGKTTSCRVIIRELKRMGLRVLGAKLTGSGRYGDILGMRDAGAFEVLDFVDVGLPSTVCPANEYREALTGLLSRMAAANPDAIVAEAGASPLEPYNGATALEMISSNVRCTVLCASDPYAVVGVVTGFQRHPDIVAGATANTEASIALVQQLTGLTTLDLTRPDSAPALRRLLSAKLQLS